MKKRILVAVPDSLCEQSKSHLNSIACDGWKTYIQFVRLKNKKLPRTAAEEQVAENADEILQCLSETEFAAVIVFGPFSAERDAIQRDLPATRVILLTSLSAFRRESNGLLKETGLHWLPYAEAQWSKAEIGHATPTIWIQQFAELGYKELAKLLLQNLRVISNAELRAAFSVSSAETIGHRVAHGFIKDDEQGSSSINVQSVLGKIYPERIIALDLNDESCWGEIAADVLYVYEDGLWSGVEIVKRMEAIWKKAAFQASNLRIHFRYCVTSDMGLAAARLYARSNNINRFYVDSSDEQNYFEFFEKNADLSMTASLSVDPNVTRKALDQLVDPYAFQSRRMIADQKIKAMEFCEKTGGQLVTIYLERENKRILAAGGSLKIIDEDRVKKWSLGAMRFASTIVFSSSVPKPVLPLFWLGGDIELNGRTITWNPLFWDARRMGQTPPKLV